MKFLFAFCTLATIFSSALATPIEIIEERDSAVPPKDKVYIKDVKFAGSGCPAGSVAVAMSQDLSNVNLLFSNYIAQVGPTIKPVETRKNCLINFNVVFPNGYTYTIFETEYTGFVSLDPKVSAIQKSEYWFTGSDQRMNYWSSWYGPVSEDYNFKDSIDVKSWVWAPCGFKSTLNVNTQIRLDNSANKAGTGLITTDSIGHHVVHKLNIKWRKC